MQENSSRNLGGNKSDAIDDEEGGDSAGFLVPRLGAPVSANPVDETDGRAHNPFGESEEAATMLRAGGVGKRPGLSRGASARSFAVEGAQEEAPSPVVEVDEEDEDALDEEDEEDEESSGVDATGVSPSPRGSGAASGGKQNGRSKKGSKGSPGSVGGSVGSRHGLPPIRTAPSAGSMRHGVKEAVPPLSGTAAQGRSFLVDANPTSARQGAVVKPRRQSMPGRTWVGMVPPPLE